MGEQVNIELSEEGRRVMRAMQTIPAWGLQALARGMDKANQLALADIQRKHLTGRGPFPPSEHRLGVRTNRLRGALWASPAVPDGQRIEAAIGDNVEYAAIHEFGGTIHHKARQGTVRLRTDAQGNLLRQGGNGNLAIFARKNMKRARAVAFQAKAHDVHMPARAPIWTGLQESAERTGKIVSEEFVSAWRVYNG